jgi:hypothetical protein
MKRSLLVLLVAVLPLCVRADQVLVGQLCVNRCQHQHFDQNSNYNFTFTLNNPAQADELDIEGQNFPGQNDITDVQLTGPGNIDLQWQLSCTGCFLTFHFDEFFSTGNYQVHLHSVEGIFTVLIGDQFTEEGCCGTMNGQQQAFVYGTPITTSEPATLSLLCAGLGFMATGLRRWRRAER